MASRQLCQLCLGLAVGIAVSASPAFAATICVNPSKASCQATVAGGISAANAGDTVAIAKGFYNENVVVPIGKDGLVIKGGRTAVLDGDDPLAGDTLTIDSNDVLVQGLTFRNGNQEAIVSNGTGTIIKGVTITGPDGDCIQVNGDDTTIVSNLLNGCGDNAIDVNADDVDIVGNKIFHCDETCIDVSGDGAIIERNTTQLTEDSYMIDLSGDNAEIVNNKLDNAESDLILASGDNILISGNKLSHGAAAIDVTGQNPVVTKNRGQHLHGGAEGIDVSCVTNCSTALVDKNKVEDVADDTVGIRVTANAAGTVVTNNSVARVENDAYDVGGAASVTFDKNKSQRNGGDRDDDCIVVRGTGGHSITNNRLADCHGNGMHVSGSGHTITGNQIKGALANGIYLPSGSGFTVNGNRVQNANGSGLAVESTTTSSSADGNSVKGVRSGLCNDSASMTVTNHSASQTDKADEILAGACPIQ